MKRLFYTAFISIFITGVEAEPVKIIPPEQKVLSVSGGRYVFGQVSGLGQHQYMLDTETGRLWNVVSSNDSGGDYKLLQQVPYIGHAGEYSGLPETIEREKEHKKLMLTNQINRGIGEMSELEIFRANVARRCESGELDSQTLCGG